MLIRLTRHPTNEEDEQQEREKFQGLSLKDVE